MKRAAVDIVRSLTGSEDGMQPLAQYSKVVLQKLSDLLGDPKVKLTSSSTLKSFIFLVPLTTGGCLMY